LETQSFVTGVRFIELEFYPEFPIRLVGLNDDFIEIPSMPTLVEEIETEIRQFVAKIEAVDWEGVKNEFEGMLASFRTTLNEISRATRSVDLTESIASLNETLDASEELLQRINSKIDPLVEEKVDLLLSDVAKVTDVIARTMESTNKLVTRFETIAVDDRYEIRAALNEFKETSRSLRILLDYIQQNPRSVIFGKEKRRK
jgi:paraquat-inducible protein B